jgi:hypothetical protein
MLLGREGSSLDIGLVGSEGTGHLGMEICVLPDESWGEAIEQA